MSIRKFASLQNLVKYFYFLISVGLGILISDMWKSQWYPVGSHDPGNRYLPESANCSSSMMSSSSATRWPRVLLLGDSLTQMGFGEGCWVSHLSNALQRRADVINRGFSGYTTHTFKAVMRDVVDKDLTDGVAAATLFLGANDANIKEVSPRQHVPIQVYKSNLKEILNFMVSAGISREKIILIPTPPNDPFKWKAVAEEKHGNVLPSPPKTNEVNREYYDAAMEVSVEFGCEAVELWDELSDDPVLFSDGLHFSGAGGKKMFDLVWPAIERRTKDIAMIQKPWKEMTPLE